MRKQGMCSMVRLRGVYKYGRCGIEVRRMALKRAKNKKEPWVKYKHCHVVAMCPRRPELIWSLLCPGEAGGRTLSPRGLVLRSRVTLL